MRHEEIARDLDQAIAKLTDAKAKVPAIAAENDLGELRKMCGAVTDFWSWTTKLLTPEAPAVSEPAVAPTAEHQKEKSEVADMLADEAKDHISRMRSPEKLEHIRATDSRKSVQEAATNRLHDLEHKGE